MKEEVRGPDSNGGSQSIFKQKPARALSSISVPSSEAHNLHALACASIAPAPSSGSVCQPAGCIGCNQSREAPNNSQPASQRSVDQDLASVVVVV